jgi:hypothetical protein
MGRTQRAVRRALNPISTRVTMLVQGWAARRAFGVRHGAAVPAASAGFAPAAGWRPRHGRRRRGGLAAPVPVGESGGGLVKAGGPVAVPDVVGMAWGDAEEVLHRAGLFAVGLDADGQTPVAGVVVDQQPEPGVVLPVGSSVTVWVERGRGSAGERELRRPNPAPRSASGMVDEESGEAIG